MQVSRRRFLAGGAALLACPRLAMAAQTADGFQEIAAAPASLSLLDQGGETKAWIFGAGPEPLVIRARQGEELKLRFSNRLPEEIWLHFFGVRGPSELMTLNVPPGADHAVDCVFTPPDAGTFWIGPVADASRLRDMGLYAMLVVEEAASAPAFADLALVLDDWKLDDSGAIEGNFGDAEAMVGEGRLGNWFTVASRYRPRFKLKAGQFTRLRLLNAANVRSMGVLFKGHDPLLIALDGQPITPRNLGDKALLLAPGQRADLLASPEDGDITLALDLFEDVVEIAYLTRDGTGAAPAIAADFALPGNPALLPGVTGAIRNVAVVIEGGIKGGLKTAKFAGQVMDLRGLLEHGKGWAFNGVAGPSGEALFAAVTGETVVLAIQNRTAFAQPLHLHGHVWQEVGVDQAPLRDTAVIAAGKSMNLAFVADNPGTWALQSLVAERADGGLMAAFQVNGAAL